MAPVVITGLGLITPLGAGVERNWSALLAGQFIRDHSRAKAPEARAKSPCHSRVAQLGGFAAREAIAQAGWSSASLSDPETCLVVGTSKGPIENWIGEPRGTGVSPVPGPAPRARRPCHDFGLAELTSDIACEIGLGDGYRTTLSAACASGLHALIHAAILLSTGGARRAIVVAAEASVHPLFVGSFRRLGVLAREGEGCRPFDVNRTGFLMSEAAAAVCLEIEETSRSLAAVDRFALGADAFHLTGADPEGKVMRRLLANVIADQPVDLVHAHATGTRLHDPVELAAIEATTGGAFSAIYSHKGAIGHSLGAAGLVAVVISTLCHRHSTAPPNIQTKNPIPSTLNISRAAVSRPIRRSTAFAAGFGGAMAAISLRSANG